ncbi:cation:H+ antiporter [Evansella caseinilytica]|uniref:Cation:H+ antiporter n=1 Tax=Evansella caseinilytica TaxID=1503961 RepID=A0A1H3PIG6_9BACI|nr:sodium:calcium antiporter [Evansella caseinilytica]SDZ00753.1 cation:H+ antiporter [Evansella caseinilytica]
MLLLFVFSALVTIISAIKLSSYADVLSKKTSLGGMLVGTLFLAGATSLPEVTTSATAVFLNNPDIAVGNVLGSNLFNLLILAVFDVIYRRKQMLTKIDKDHVTTGFISLGLTGVVLASILSPSGVAFLGIGIESYLLIIFYVVSMRMMSPQKQESVLEQTAAATDNVRREEAPSISLKKAKIGFAVSAVIIFVTGSLLTYSGDAIADATGMSASFIGSFLIAGATSLPEVVSVLVAVRLFNYNLAVGNILGSNIFNLLILVFTDVLYRGGSLLEAADTVTAVTALTVILLNIIVLGSILFFRTNRKTTLGYSIPSLLLIILYAISSFLIFSLS